MFRACVAACSLVCCGHLAGGGSPSIAVFLDFESEPSAGTISEMKNEIAAIMKPSGLQFDWRMLKERQSGESFPDLVVVTFKGSCQADQPLLYNELGPVHVEPVQEGTALAFTWTSDGRILPFSAVECDTIRKYIGPAVAWATPEKRNGILGRAMGRVLAHEMYHIFAGTQAHGNDGVARAFHTRKELTARKFQFTPRESQVLRDLKWKQLLLSGEGRFPDTAGLTDKNN